MMIDDALLAESSSMIAVTVLNQSISHRFLVEPTQMLAELLLLLCSRLSVDPIGLRLKLGNKKNNNVYTISQYSMTLL